MEKKTAFDSGNERFTCWITWFSATSRAASSSSSQMDCGNNISTLSVIYFPLSPATATHYCSRHVALAGDLPVDRENHKKKLIFLNLNTLEYGEIYISASNKFYRDYFSFWIIYIHISKTMRNIVKCILYIDTDT